VAATIVEDPTRRNGKTTPRPPEGGGPSPPFPWSAVAGDRLGFWRNWTRHGQSGVKPPHSNGPVQTAHYALRWINTRSQPGPWSETVSATIPA
jgi:hypothetical protein